MVIRSGCKAGADCRNSSVRCRFAAEGHALMAGTHFDKQALAVSQDRSGIVKDAGLGPMLAAFVMVDAAFEANGRTAENRAPVVHLHVTCHTYHVAGADGLAHGFVEQGGDDAAVEKAARAFERVGDCRHADHGTVVGQHEFEMQTGRICRAAPETAIMCGMRERGELFGVCFHSICASSLLSKAEE